LSDSEVVPRWSYWLIFVVSHVGHCLDSTAESFWRVSSLCLAWSGPVE